MLGIRAFIAYVLFSGLCFAATYPALTGRVVDGANILSPDVESQLTDQLATHERQTTNQVVVVTVPSLQGESIEEYGVALGRKWGIGQKGKNNGVLLIIAPNDRQVRIEVGYGLEGTLTDALSSRIIQSVMLPRFKAGDMAGGTYEGVQAILGTLGGKPYAIPAGSQLNDDWLSWFAYGLIFLAVCFFHRFGRRSNGGGRSGAEGSGGKFGGGNSGGGFKGGGGGFGGGGSSGRW